MFAGLSVDGIVKNVDAQFDFHDIRFQSSRLEVCLHHGESVGLER